MAIKTKSKQLKCLQDKEDPTTLREIMKLQQELHGLMDQEELKWRQRAKKHWYNSGNRNTKFLHACANQHRRKNFIKQIVDDQQLLHTSVAGIEEAFNCYFSTIFSSIAPTQAEIEKCVPGIQPRVTEEMNSNLQQPFTRLEIERALQQMGPLKSPGSDGFGAGFYQKALKYCGLGRL